MKPTALLVSIVVLFAALLAPTPPAGASSTAFQETAFQATVVQPTRSLIVVGDSIVLSASEELVASAPADWNVQIDAKVSRPTNVGHDIVRGNLAAISDTLVIGLGANDAASPDVFRKRAAALLADVANVPHVFWIEIAEVRDYYPTANANIRELANSYPNVSIVPWTALATGTPGLTASDGLHLTGPGQQALADAILSLVVQTESPTPAPVAELIPGPDEPQSTSQDVTAKQLAPVLGAARLQLIAGPLLATLRQVQAIVALSVASMIALTAATG